MHITKVELENIKSHALLVKEFERGTTAITGTNGAGKTTILEAVAWTLFDLLDYKKDDFVRRGQKKGIARITFESSLDERRYTVYRDTGTGYYIFDPQIKAKIADKKEEVTKFLRQHLGVEAGTDLEALFRRAIGVPQGTFTAIFLESATERKKAFDKLLKVEEYRQGAEKLLETARYLEAQTTAARERIARAEGELSRLDLLEIEQQEILSQIAELGKVLADLKDEITRKTASVSELDAVEKSLDGARKNLEKVKLEADSAIREESRIAAEFKRAETASAKLKEVEPAHLRHLSALSELAKLEQRRTEQAKFQKELSQIETKIANAKAEQKRIADALQKAHEAGREAAALEPQITRQEEFERERETVRTSLAEAKSHEKQIQIKQREIDERRKSYTENQTKIKDAEARTALAENLQMLILRDQEITNSLAELRAKLKADEDFQVSIKNGLCPILSQKCLNLRAGETLESFVKSKFTENKTQISTLEKEQKDVAGNLKAAREAENFAASLKVLKQREAEIKEEGQRLKADLENLQKLVENIPALEKSFAEIEANLRELANPRERSTALKKEAERENDWREKAREIEKAIADLDDERKVAAENLEVFAEVDALFAKFQTERDATQTAHREFLANESLAKSLAEREKDLAEIRAKVENLQKQSAEFLGELNAVEAKYDAHLHQSEKVALLSAQTREAESKARFESAKSREKVINSELERLSKIREEMKAEFAEKDRLEKVTEATRFIRDTLKEAAPRVARNYVFHISNEANQLFRDITGNAERTLKWTEDYGIALEENGYERPFINLSGGEQMAAALAVRLAILKQLSDVRIAFFDEPTTNMDAQRRERLAEQISHITEKRSFDQLFVISHDDTFEGYVDNVVNIGSSESFRTVAES